MLWKKSLDTWIVHYPYRKTQRWLVGVFVTAGVAVVVAVAVAVAVHMASSKFQSRSIRHVTVAKSRGEGDGATVRRAIGGSEASIYFLSLGCPLSCWGYYCCGDLVV